MGRLARKLNMRDEMRFAVAAARGTQALGRTTQAAHSTIAVGDADVPLVEAVDTAVAVGEEIPQVSEEAGLAGDDAWEAWDQSEFAKQLSEAAAQVAEEAQTSADGKSRVVRSTSAATAAGSYKDGDQWWQFSGANIVGLWLHDGTGWAQQVVTSEVIASLDAGKITTGVLAADRIGSNSITTAKLAATAIDGMTITGATMRTAAAGQRMQFDINGLRAYNAAGAVVATLQSNAGALFVDGGMRASTNLMVGGLTGDSSRLEKDRLLLTQVSGSTTTRLATVSNSVGFEHVAGVNTPQAQSILSRSDQILMERYRTYPTDRQGRIQLTTYGAGDTAELTLESKETPSSPVRELRVGIRNGYYGLFVDGSIQQVMTFTPDGVKFLGDTDWVDLSSSILATYRNICRARRTGPGIEILFDGGSAAVPAGNTTLGTLPAAWRPLIAPNRRSGAYFQGGYTGVFYLTPSGEFGVSQQTGASRAGCQGHMIFNAD